MPDAPSFEADPSLYGPNANGGMVSLGTRRGATGQPADNYWSNLFMRLAQAQSPQVQLDGTNQMQARAQQNQIIQDLQRSARGDPNSLAQQQLLQQYQQAASQQASLGSTLRGQNAGAAMRSIQQGQQGLNRGLAGDQQMLQMQEQQAAQQALAQMLAQQQGQDISQANLMAQTALGNQSLTDALRQFYASLGSNYDIEQGQIAGERNRAALGFDLEGKGLTNQLLGRGVQAVGTAAATWANQPRSSQSTIDDAFDNG